MNGKTKAALVAWATNPSQVRERLYGAPTARERERWHGLWLLAQGWTAQAVGEALGRDPHTIGQWLAAYEQQGPSGLAFEQTGGPPPP